MGAARGMAAPICRALPLQGGWRREVTPWGGKTDGVPDHNSQRNQTFPFVECACGRLVRQINLGTVLPEGGCEGMKAKAQKVKPDQQDDDDMWTWVVIGLIFGAVSLTLYGPLVWQTMHGS